MCVYSGNVRANHKWTQVEECGHARVSVNWWTQNHPLVIGLPRSHANTKCEQAHCPPHACTHTYIFAGWVTSMVCHQPALQTHTHTFISAKLGISPPFSLKQPTDRHIEEASLCCTCSQTAPTMGHPVHDPPGAGSTLQSSEVTRSVLEPGYTQVLQLLRWFIILVVKHSRYTAGGKWLQCWMPVRAGLGPTPLNHENHLFRVSVIFIWTIRQHGSKWTAS